MSDATHCPSWCDQEHRPIGLDGESPPAGCHEHLVAEVSTREWSPTIPPRPVAVRLHSWVFPDELDGPYIEIQLEGQDAAEIHSSQARQLAAALLNAAEALDIITGASS